MKYALYEFMNEDGALAVEEAALIEDLDKEEDASQLLNTEVVVKWPTGKGKSKAANRLVARILAFSDDKRDLLADLSNRLEDDCSTQESASSGSRLSRKRKIKSIDSEEEDSVEDEKKTKKQKKTAKIQAESSIKKSDSQILKAAKGSYTLSFGATVEPGHKERYEALKSKYAACQAENLALKEKLLAVTQLPNVVARLEALLGTNFSTTLEPRRQLGSAEMAREIMPPTTPKAALTVRPNTPSSATSKSTPQIQRDSGSTPIQAVDEDELSEIPEHLLKKIEHERNPRTVANMILHGLFTDEYLASHTVSEATKTKQPLPQAKVQAIIDVVQAKDPSISAVTARLWMREKLLNTSKKVNANAKPNKDGSAKTGDADHGNTNNAEA